MRGSFFGLEIGRTGLSTAQFGLDVTGHNIANLDTAGFTRQRVVTTANDPFATVGRFAPTGQGLVGGGVRVQVLDQIRSAHLDRRFRTESTTNAYWETRTQSLQFIESLFDNVNERTSINHTMAEFFRAMTIVAQDPVSGAPRTLMRTSAMDMVQQLNMIHDSLINFQQIENRAIVTKTNEINRMAQGISDLNTAIYEFEITGMRANDLRDKRNLLLDQLARIVDIDYEEYPDQFGHSMLRVRVGGDLLVDHNWSNELAIGWLPNVIPGEAEVAVPVWATSLNVSRPNPNDPNFETALIAYQNAVRSASLDMSRVNGGELRAHMDMRDGIGGGVDSTQRGIPYYIEMVNNLARALVQEINRQHVQGWSDHPEGSRTGVLFFDDTGLDGERIGEVRFFDADGNRLPDPVDPDDPLIARAEYFIHPDRLQNITARNLRLSDDIQSSAFNIAASSTRIGRAGEGDSEELQRGNNVNMNRLHDLFRDTSIRIQINGEWRDIGGFDDYGTTIRFDVANTLHTARQAMDTSRVLTLAADNQRMAVAGVSLDEEMVGLVRYNHAYNGAARIITAMDEALDRLINGTGRVGL